MPYAHLWASGQRPYLDQWYEYPPATIPLFYIPHIIDRGTLNYPAIHLDYLQSYRGLLLLVDIALFTLIWKTLRKQKVKNAVFYGALLYYIAATAKAHHFMYDSMDLTFIAAVTFGIAAPILFSGLKKSIFFSWFGYALAVALKYINAPLGLIYALSDRKNLKKHVIFGSLAILSIWIVPLLMYRSSLSVSFVYHNIRGLQIDTAGAVIARTIDIFTKSETVINIYKNFEMSGPISTQILLILNILFPLSIAVFLLYSCIVLLRSPVKDSKTLCMQFTLSYILLFMLVGKVQSTPFLLWHIPLIAIYPFSSLKNQLLFTVPSLIILGVSMIIVPFFMVGVFTSYIFSAWIRTILFLFLFILSLRLHKFRSM